MLAAEAAAARFFTPGPEDWASLDLPPRLDGLYWANRPLLLTLKYARKTTRAG